MDIDEMRALLRKAQEKPAEPRRVPAGICTDCGHAEEIHDRPGPSTGVEHSCRAPCPCRDFKGERVFVIDSASSLAKEAPEGDILTKDGVLITDQWRLKFQKGASDKVYFVHIMDYGADYALGAVVPKAQPARYSVNTEWGRRGAKRQKQVVTWTNELDHARNEANKIVDAKKEKGYIHMDETFPKDRPR